MNTKEKEMKTISIGSDRSGFYIKSRIIDELSGVFKFIDEGTYSDSVCDYPIFAEKVCTSVIRKKSDFGVLICGSGEGMCIAANKIPGIRCGIAYNDDVARLLRNHNDANVVSFGARFMSYDEIKNRLLIFCNSVFLCEHHSIRIKQIIDLEHKKEGEKNMYYVDPTIKSFLRTYQPEGRAPFIRLDQNENPDGLPQWVFDEAMKKISPSFLSMYPEEIVFRGKYASVLGIEPNQLTLTDGSVVGMGYIIKVFGKSGKKLLCVTPTFGMYKVYGDMVGMETVSIKYNGDYTFDVSNILQNINNETGIVVLVNPNMPIGNAYSREEVLSVVKKAQNNNAVVIIDEAYLYFNDESFIDLIDKYDNVIILRTFSKMFSMPGLRLGAIISNKEFIQYINNYKPHYTINCVAITFAETIVDHYDKVLKELKEIFNEGKHYLLSKLDEAGYSYLPTKGCFVCIYPKYKTAEKITEELKNNGILIFCGKGDSAGFLRVTIWNKKYMKIFIDTLLRIDTK